MHSLIAYSKLVEVLQRLRALYKELIWMSHRYSGTNLTNMWEGSVSNNTLDSINTKQFLWLLYQSFFEQLSEAFPSQGLTRSGAFNCIVKFECLQFHENYKNVCRWRLCKTAELHNKLITGKWSSCGDSFVNCHFQSQECQEIAKVVANSHPSNPSLASQQWKLLSVYTKHSQSHLKQRTLLLVILVVG